MLDFVAVRARENRVVIYLKYRFASATFPINVIVRVGYEHPGSYNDIELILYT